MKRIKRLSVFALCPVLLLGTSLGRSETQAAAVKTHKVKVSLSGTKTVRAETGKKNITKKTLTVKEGDEISFSHARNKKFKTAAYKSMNKKYVTITKRGKAAAKKAGTAKIKITVQLKKGKALSTRVKIKVKGDKKTDDNGQNPPSAADSGNPSDTPDDPVLPPSDTLDDPVLPPSDIIPDDPVLPPSDTPDDPTMPPADPPSQDGKSLVLYFSRAGENYNVGVVEKAAPGLWQK